MNTAPSHCFFSDFPVDLYRAGSVNGPDYLRLRLPPLPNNREPDIAPFQNPSSGELWVRAGSGGASNFDAMHDKFRRGRWWLMRQGTTIPHGLMVIKDSYNPYFSATHCTIAPAVDMPLAELLRLLESLQLHAMPVCLIG